MSVAPTGCLYLHQPLAGHGNDGARLVCDVEHRWETVPPRRQPALVVHEIRNVVMILGLRVENVAETALSGGSLGDCRALTEVEQIVEHMGQGLAAMAIPQAPHGKLSLTVS